MTRRPGLRVAVYADVYVLFCCIFTVRIPPGNDKFCPYFEVPWVRVCILYRVDPGEIKRPDILFPALPKYCNQ